MTYLQNGLIDHDPDAVLLSDTARHQLRRGACPDPDSLRRIILPELVAAIHNLRLVVDGDDAVVVYDMLVDWTRSEQSDSYADPSTWRSAYIGERFHVVDGLIEEIEVVYAVHPERSAPLERPSRTPPASADAPGRDDGIAVRQTYLDALFSGDGSSVLLRRRVAHRERARHGRQRPAIQQMLTQMLGKGRGRHRHGRPPLVRRGEEAVAFYTLDIDPTALGQADAEPVRMAIVERFRVHDGLITEVEPVIPGWIE